MPARRPRPLELAFGLPLAVVGGVVVGTLATIKARAGTATGLPYGLVLALLLVLVFVLAVRAGTRARVFAAAAAVGVLVPVYALLLPGRGGGQVVVPDATGIVWLVAPAVLVVLAVTLPAPRRRGRRAPDEILEGPADEGTPAP